MASRAVMRFSPQTWRISRDFEAHHKTCRICGAVRARDTEALTTIALGRAVACLIGTMLAEEWKAEYLRLHSAAERQALEEFQVNEMGMAPTPPEREPSRG